MQASEHFSCNENENNSKKPKKVQMEGCPAFVLASEESTLLKVPTTRRRLYRSPYKNSSGILHASLYGTTKDSKWPKQF